MTAPQQIDSTPDQGVETPPGFDLAIGIGFVVSGAVLVYGAQGFPAAIPNTLIGPGLMPLICAIVFLLGGATLAIKAFAAIRAGRKVAEGEDTERGSLGFSAVVLGGMVLCVLAMPYLGFVVTTALYAFAVTLAGRSKWWGAALYSGALTFGVYALFQMVLRVPLPTASLF